MVLIDIFRNIFDGYDVGELGPVIFILIPFVLSVLFSFMILFRSLRPRKNFLDTLMYIPPFFVYVTAAMVEVGLVLMLFQSMKSPPAFVLSAHESHGAMLHLEIVLAAAATGLLVWLYSKFSQRYVEKTDQTRVHKLATIFDYSIVVLTGLAAFYFLLSGHFEHFLLRYKTLDEYLHGLYIWDYTLPYFLSGLYLYLAYYVLIKGILLLFNFVWSFLFGARPSDDIGRGTDPLKRLVNSLRIYYTKAAGIVFIAIAMPIGIILAAMLTENRVHAINHVDDMYQHHMGTFVSVPASDIELIMTDFAYASFADNPAHLLIVNMQGGSIYILATAEQYYQIVSGQTDYIVGKNFHALYFFRDYINRARGHLPMTHMPHRYINHMEQPDYSLYRYIPLAIAIPFICIVPFVFLAVFSKLNLSVRALYRRYPNLDEVMQHIRSAKENYRDGSSDFYSKYPITITKKYVILEAKKSLDIFDMGAVVQYQPQGLCMEVVTESGKHMFIRFPSEESRMFAENMIFPRAKLGISEKEID